MTSPPYVNKYIMGLAILIIEHLLLKQNIQTKSSALSGRVEQPKRQGEFPDVKFKTPSQKSQFARNSLSTQGIAAFNILIQCVFLQKKIILTGSILLVGSPVISSFNPLNAPSTNRRKSKNPQYIFVYRFLYFGTLAGSALHNLTDSTIQKD